MVELLTLHATDTHEDSRKTKILRQFVESKKGLEDEIDAFFFTGDAAQAHKSKSQDTMYFSIIKSLAKLENNPVIQKAQSQLTPLLEKYVTPENKGEIEISSIKPEDRKKVEEINNLMIQESHNQIGDAIINTYEKLRGEFKPITDLVPTYGVLGNHDLIQGYDVLSDIINFVELGNGVKIKGKTGTEFVVKGDLNTYEVPRFFSSNPLLREALEGSLINYLSGQDRNKLEVNKKLAELGGNKDLIKDVELQMKVLDEYQQKERERLGPANEVDIYLSHKAAVSQLDTGNITGDYAKHASANMAGHHHKACFGKKGIDDLLKSANDDVEIIDGEEVKVYRLGNEEIKHINPADKYFAVTAFDKDKNVEYVDIYAYDDFIAA